MTPKGKAELLFVALGGAGEIGMNLNLYGFGAPGRHRWMMVDLGVTFADGTPPGFDVIMADPAFIEERREQLDGLVLTHAHEDHLGATAYLWERLECPIYATGFTASILRRKLRETGLESRAKITEVPLKGHFSVGPFDLEMISLTHSIPEPNSIAIRTPLGTVLHTGDWKFDPGPVVGPTADEEALHRLGEEGVLAMIGDSTNVFSPGPAASEADLKESLTRLIAGCPKRIAVACFATNVARLETISAAARANGRDVALAGRSLRRIDEAARENGYLADTPAFLDEGEAGFLPDDKALIICTGSQGEPRAALARIAAGSHPRLSLGEGDTVIFSSKIIPGNEMSIARLHNRLISLGVEVITEQDAFVHVTGHPCRDEMIRLYQLVSPRIAVPVHGEVRHLMAHGELAAGCKVAEQVVATNGEMVRLAPGGGSVVDHVEVGRLALDGNRLVRLDGEMARERGRALYNGVATVSLALDSKGRLAGAPQFSTVGLLGAEEGFGEAVEGAVDKALGTMAAGALKDDDQVREAVRIAVRRVFRETLAKKPLTKVHLHRL